MARESGRNNSELKEEIARSRARVTRDLRGLRDELDFPKRIRRSFRRQPVPWIVVTAVAGVFLVLSFTRKKKVYVDAVKASKSGKKLLEVGFVLGALRIAATLLKPVILKFVERKMHGYASGARPAKKW
jgi:hypothetical protein